MDYRQLGNSKIKASVITFGAWAIGGSMWGGSDEDDAVEAIKASIDAGVTSIDTAPVYGYGKSEDLVSKAIAGQRDKVQIFTKFGLNWDSDEENSFSSSMTAARIRRSIATPVRKQSFMNASKACVD